MPMRVLIFNEFNLISPRSIFDIFFALNGLPRAIARLVINQTFETVTLRKTFDTARFVIKNTARQVTCHTRINRTIFVVRHNVNEEKLFHAIM